MSSSSVFMSGATVDGGGGSLKREVVRFSRAVKMETEGLNEEICCSNRVKMMSFVFNGVIGTWDMCGSRRQPYE